MSPIATYLEGNLLIPNETTENTDAALAVAPETHDHAAIEHAHDHDHEHHDHTHQHEPSLNPELLREITVEAPAEEVTKSFNTVIKRYQKLARIPGFRAGKVPESLIRSKFAKDVRQEVMESLVSERFRLALEEQKLSPVSQPQITELNLVDGQPLRFKAAFEILPEFDVTGYDTITVEKPVVELTDEEYTAELDRLLDSHATVETLEEDRPLVDGDWAEIQFTGTVQPLVQTVTEEGVESKSDEEPIRGEDVLVEIGGKNTLPAFTEALRGQKVGQELTLEVAYPADFGEPRLAGKTVSYDVVVKTLKRKNYPEKNAEFAQQVGDYESWEDFETKFRDNVASRKKQAAESEAKDKMVDALVSKYEFPIPESFVQQQVDARLDRGLRALAQQGMPAEEMRKLDFNRLRTAQRDEALSEVRASLILDRIAEAEKVEVTESDVDRELLMLSLQSREPLETLRERLTQDGTLNRIREQMRREKTGTVLYEKLTA